MARRGARDVQVGGVFALALIILAVTVMALGGNSRLFSERYDYQVSFANAEGLSEGSPVKMSGVTIGSVHSIRLSTDPGVGGIEVQFGVDPLFAERIREDSAAALRISSSFLTGEKFVEVVPGSPELPQLPPGSVLPSLQPPELLEQAAATAENLNQITVSLQKILVDLEEGRGLLGQMITDPDFGVEGIEALKGTLDNLRALTGDIRKGRGFFGRMIYDEEFARTLDDLGQVVARVRELADGIDPQKGALGALMEEGGAAEQAVADLAIAAASLRATAERLESREGLVGRLLNDPEYSEGVAARPTARPAAPSRAIREAV